MELNDLDGTEFEIAQMGAEGLSVRHIAARLNLTERTAAARLRVVFDKLGVRDRRELRTKIGTTEWQRALGSIRAFIDAHGHSRIPESYRDEDGMPLAGLVSNIRWRHAGRDWLGEGRRPQASDFFPGVDYEAELDRLRGWTWENETASEIPELRSGRQEAHIVRALGLAEGIGEADYIRAITTALRASEEAPWPWIRARLAEKGVEARSAVLADFFPDRHQACFLAVVIGPDTKAHAFCMLFFGDPDRPEEWSALKLNEWRELDKTNDRDPYEQQIALGIRLLEEPRA